MKSLLKSIYLITRPISKYKSASAISLNPLVLYMYGGYSFEKSENNTIFNEFERFVFCSKQEFASLNAESLTEGNQESLN